MDENSEIIKKFEEILRNKRSVKPISLYSGSKKHNLSDNKVKSSQYPTPQEVLKSVSKQLKAIQNADCITNNKCRKKINTFKQTTFLPVTIFEKEFKAQQSLQAKHANKFETQSVSDSQLINLIQDAEIMDEQSGVTQEFDHTFCYNDKSLKKPDTNNDFNDSDKDFNDINMLSVNNSIKMEEDLELPAHNDSNESNNLNKQSLNAKLSKDKVKSENNVSNTKTIFPIIDISLKEPKIKDVFSVPEANANDIEVIFENAHKETNEVINFDYEITDMPSSPIFNVKSVKNLQNLVFDLQKFEEFEQLATPIIETVDFETAKCLINSQIIGKELFLPSTKDKNCTKYNSEHEPESFEAPLNAVLENRETTKENKEIRDKIYKNGKENVQFDVRDEILFSSDEEEELLRKDSEEIPITCQLDLSGFENDNFDETMYVGFQTASNKSIQICTKSFFKAKDMFDNDNLKANSKESLIADLVEKFDDKFKQNLDSKISNAFVPKESVKNIECGNGSISIKEENVLYSNITKVQNKSSFSNNTVYSGDMTLTNISADRVIRDNKKLQANIEETHLFDTIENMRDIITDIITQDCYDVIDTCTFEEISNGSKSLITNYSFLDSKIASNKTITISKDALIKSKNILESVNIDVTKCIPEPNGQNFETNKENMEVDNFINLGPNKDDNDVLIEPLNKTSNVNENINEIDFKIYNNTKQERETEFINKLSPKITKSEIQISKSFPGFKTANNKEIKISSEALLKSKKMLQVYEDLAIKDDKNIHFDEFKSASSKNITISEIGLAKSKSIKQEMQNTNQSKNKLMNKDFMSPLKTKTNPEKHVKKDDASALNSENKTSHFQRFQTASNKRIEISKKALEKSKKIFQDINDDDINLIGEINENITENRNDNNDVEDLLENSNIIEEFEMEVFENEAKINSKESKTIDEIKVKISNEITVEISKSNEILGKKSNVKEQTFGLQEPAKFQGFKTANNKQIVVSKEALAKTKKIFEGLDSVNTDDLLKQESFQLAKFDTFDGIDNINQIKKEGTEFVGFKTASMKEVTISKKALARSLKIFEGIDINTENIQNKQETAKFVGFQTASKKEVAVSKEALERSTQIFAGIDCLSEDNIPKQVKFGGFQTASKKEVTVSKEALARSIKIFEGIDVNTEYSLNKQEPAKFAGFKTASKKEVTFSKVALARSKRIFEGIDINSEIPNKQEIAKFVGFQTASKKEVTVSKEALERSKRIFEGINNTVEDKHSKLKPAKFLGFHTASNKKVEISEEALAKSKKLLEIGEENRSTNSNIDAQAFANTRHTFNDVHKLDANPNNVNSHSEFGGFQTASKKQVTVSEDAIRKSKFLFQDITENENDINLNNKVNFNEEIIQSQVFTLKSVSKTDSKVNITSKNAAAEINCIIDTQLLNNFDQTLYTEDFGKELSRKSKRSGSPILSCPKPKKRKKFEIPYSQMKSKVNTDCVVETSNILPTIHDSNLPKVEFDSNYKKIKKYTLKDLENIEKEYPETERDCYILNFNFEELLNFDFFGKRNELTDTKITTKDLRYIFEKSVNKKLIPENWIENHVQLIIWKLISYEIRFPKCMTNTCTARNVIDQLKYRYDKELFNMERPPLRKIFEKDDIPSRCMVLCVVLIYENGASVSSIASLTNNVEILLTDGWYSIRTTIDKMVTKLIFDGQIKIGSKIMVQGAELLGCEQGIAPWEDTSAIRLKITGNSTRPVKWHVKLGYTSLTMLSRLSQVSSDGGKVSKLRVFVSRVYPALYVEKLEDNCTVTRSERLELLHQMKHETERQALIEKIYEEVEKEFQDQDSQESDSSEPSNKRRCLETGSQIARVMKSAKDPGDFQSHLSSTQKDLLQEHTMRKRDKLIQNVQERVKQKIDEVGLHVNRNVVTLVKVRLVDIEEKRGKTEINRALLSIWKPNDLVMEIIKEGSWVEIMNVVPTAVRYSELQISANRQSIFRKSKLKESEKIQTIASTLKRTCYNIKELTKTPSMATEYSEIDTIGFIFLIEPDNQNFDANKSQFQNVFLTDSDKNIICVNFWGGLKKFGYENVLDTGQIVACVNLQKRAGNSRKNIPQYRATEYSYFTKTPKSDVARMLIEDLSLKFSTIDRRKFCEDCVSIKSNYSIVKFQGAEISPYRFQEVNLSKNKVFIDSPLACKSEDFNLTGLDFESTFKQTDTQDLSPKSLLRKKRVNEKIAKIKYYGEPPPALSPIQINNISKNAANPFKSPFQPKLNVASKEDIVIKKQNKVENSDENIDSSPVLNKTYVKKNINPVKLNFSNANDSNIENTVDNFAEDFDCSPPLSLD